ncbi:MAG TPA: LrgB family protein [Burkholderiaceae bacterium]
MPHFATVWFQLAATPLLSLTATLAVYLLAHAFYTRCHFAPWANPVLWSMALIVLLLWAARVPYASYFAGAQFIHFLLGPAVVALAWPMWQRRAALRAGWARLLLAALAGGVAACASAVGLAWALGLPHDIVLSLAPKSVTTPVAMGVADALGGIPALAAVFAIVTGLVGALSGKYLFALLRIPATPAGWVARGFALGTAAHGIGAARALQVHEEAGAYAGVALGLQVVLAAVLIPLAFRLL